MKKWLKENWVTALVMLISLFLTGVLMFHQGGTMREYYYYGD